MCKLYFHYLADEESWRREGFVYRSYRATAFHLSTIINYRPQYRRKCMATDTTIFVDMISAHTKNHIELKINGTVELPMSRDRCTDYGHVFTCRFTVFLTHVIHRNLRLKVKRLEIAHPNTPVCDYGGLLITDSPTRHTDEYIYPSFLCQEYYMAKESQYFYPFNEYYTRHRVIHISYHSYTMGLRDGRGDVVSVVLEPTQCQGVHHLCQPKTKLETPLVPITSINGFPMLTPGEISSDCMNHTSLDPVGDASDQITEHYIEYENLKLCRITGGKYSYMTNYFPYENTQCLRIQYHPRFQPPEGSTRCGISIVVKHYNRPILKLNLFHTNKKKSELDTAPYFEAPAMILDNNRTDILRFIQRVLPKEGYFNISYNKDVGQLVDRKLFDNRLSNILWLDGEYSGSYILRANEIQHSLSKHSYHVAHWDLTSGEYFSLADGKDSGANESEFTYSLYD